MWGDSVPNGSLQWSISCLVCEPLWINVWKDHSARSLMQKTTVDLAQHPAAQLPSCPAAQLPSCPAFQHIVPRAAFAFQFLSFCFDSLCINVWQVSKLWNALIGIVKHARRHLSMRHLEKKLKRRVKSYCFQKMQGSNRLGRVLRCLSSLMTFGKLPLLRQGKVPRDCQRSDEVWTRFGAF